mgnify:CR=1 FL=1|jgi:predicted transcriptional regulator
MERDKITLYIPDDLLIKLTEKAAEFETSVNSLASYSLKKYFERENIKFTPDEVEKVKNIQAGRLDTKTTIRVSQNVKKSIDEISQSYNIAKNSLILYVIKNDEGGR